MVDLVCYRRRGHNEGDEPSMTQPLMYNLIEAKRSVRKLYTEALVGRGDITQEIYDEAHRDFQSRLEQAFAETHEAQTGTIPTGSRRRRRPGGRPGALRAQRDEDQRPARPRSPPTCCSAIGDALRRPARGLHRAPEAAGRS